jgi:hypothetical protein
MPAWLATLLVAGGLGAAGALTYMYLLPKYRNQAAAVTRFEAPPMAAEVSKPVGPHPLAKHVELTGFRLTEDSRKTTQLRLLVVNHSAADISDLGLDVVLRAAAARPDAEPVGSFSLKVASIGPYESRDIVVPLRSKLRAYEIPDWQFLKAEFQITSPPANP